jgi:large subunit ribosomal protein L22
MTGPKLNEKAFVAGERVGTKASARYIRMSASKVRVVLDLIRGLPVRNADEVLQFTDREAATAVRKVLASAVANAQHNDEQDPEELFVKACYADEGPTLKRFTPRARGRAGRIRKRTCHITILVDRLDDERLEVVQAREAKRTAAGRRRGAAASGAAGRRARVERSRQRAVAARTGDQAAIDELVDDHVIDDSEAEELNLLAAAEDAADETDVVSADSEDAQDGTDVDTAGEGSASDEPEVARGESEADAEPTADTDEEDK